MRQPWPFKENMAHGVYGRHGAETHVYICRNQAQVKSTVSSTSAWSATRSSRYTKPGDVKFATPCTTGACSIRYDCQPIRAGKGIEGGSVQINNLNLNAKTNRQQHLSFEH